MEKNASKAACARTATFYRVTDASGKITAVVATKESIISTANHSLKMDVKNDVPAVDKECLA